jgi:hypothetical protein
MVEAAVTTSNSSTIIETIVRAMDNQQKYDAASESLALCLRSMINMVMIFIDNFLFVVIDHSI